MRVGSLFSGSGGFDLGLERAGHTIAFQCELDPFRSSILRRHWPDVPLIKDVKNVRAGAVPDVDLLCGGFPCRDLSTAGKRKGIEHADSADGSGLFFETARVADDLLRPGGWLFLENVPGLLSASGGRDFAVLLRTLGDIGLHDLAWRVLDSRLHGVPQSRRRVFILARRADGSAARDVLLEHQGGEGDPAESGGEGADPAGADDGGAEADSNYGMIEGGQTHGQNALFFTEGLSRTLHTRVNQQFIWEPVEAVTGHTHAHALMAEGHDASEDGTGRGTPLIMEETRIRRLTPVEAERLQGFPDRWSRTDGPSLRDAPSWYDFSPEERPRAVEENPGAVGPRYEAMGRAVTVPVIEAIGRRLRESEDD